MFIQAIDLRNVPNVRADLFRGFAKYKDLSLCWLLKSHKQVQKSRFAPSIRTEDPYKFPFIHLKADVFEDGGCIEMMVEALNLKSCPIVH